MASVGSVYDGDTFEVQIRGRTEVVRLIGLNAPERAECFSDEARELLAGLLPSGQIALSADVDEIDQFGRLLRYAYAGQTLVNEELIRLGAARANAYPPNIAHQERLKRAEDDARTEGAGLWSSCWAPVPVALDVNADAPGPDEENLNGEWVTLLNQSADSLDLSGWRMRDGSSTHRFEFPDGTLLDPGSSLRLHTGCGTPTPGEIYWCSEGPVWNNSFDVAVLFDDEGLIAAEIQYER